MTKRIVYGPEQRGEGLNVVGERIHVLARADETGAGEAFIQEGPAGSGPPPHMHPWDEAYLMLEGEMDVLIGPETVRLRPGMFAYIPAGTVHNFRDATAGRFFSYTSAPGAAAFFADFDREAPTEIPQMVAIAMRNRVTVPPPPGP